MAVDEKGLTIRGFDSAWLADLVAAYIFQHSEDLFASLIYYGTYRDVSLKVRPISYSLPPQGFCTEF